MKSEQTKEHIIKVTTELIQEKRGNLEQVTIRDIAKRAQVGVGLINHYFVSKENLIEICTQVIISDVVTMFHINASLLENPKALTQDTVKQVVDYLMEQKELAKVSMLGDLKEPKHQDNTFRTVLGLAFCISGGVTPEKSLKQAYFLTGIIQTSFLRKERLLQELGVDFYDKEQRDRYLDQIVAMVMEG